MNYHFFQGTRLFASAALEKVASENLDDNYTDSAPRYKTSVMLMQSIGNQFDTALTYHYRSKMDWLLIRDSIGSYHRWDASAFYKFQRAGLRGRIGWKIQGLFGSPPDYQPNVKFDPAANLTLELHFL